jgi:hypothetical protein
MKKYCEYVEWSVSTYAEKIKNREILLPKFQRGISWNRSKQVKLISSIQSGFPIGAILLAKKSISGDSPERYRIIDGLQRTHAISEFLKEPTKELPTSEYPAEWNEFGVWLINEFLEADKDLDFVVEFLHKYLENSKLSNLQNSDIINLAKTEVDENCSTRLLDSSEFRSRSEKFHESIRDHLDIDSVTVPVIVYDGPEDLLPEIFERLNSQGVSLSKYQLLAASWFRECSIENQEITDAIRNYYLTRLNTTEFEIENVEDDGVPETTTLFDYLVGLGTLLTDQFPVLFDKSWESDIGFQIATVAHRLPLSNMKLLEGKFSRNADANNQLETEQFTNAVVSVCKEVEKALGGRLQLKLNRGSDKNFAGHTAFQIATIVTRLLVEFYESPQWSPIKDVSELTNYFQFIRRWYLSDRLKGQWGNAGDSLFFRTVWTRDEDSEHLSPTVETLRASQVSELKVTLDNWFEREILRKDKSRSNVSADTKLVLRYFYYHKLKVAEENELYFHLDHIVPIKWWKDFFVHFKDQDGLPINSIGNLCLMPISDNEDKLDKTPYVWFTEKKDDKGLVDRCRDTYFLVEPSLFRYPDLVGEISEITDGDLAVYANVENPLIDTSRERWTVMRDLILEKLA